MEAMAHNAPRNFWRECKRSPAFGESVCYITDDVTDDDDMAEILTSKCQDIYNCVSILGSYISGI